MHLDALAKQYQYFFLAGFLAVVAYFHARGLNALVAYELDKGAPKEITVTQALFPPALDPNHATTARAILERNPFDSVTGPLTGRSPRAEGSKDQTEPNARCRFGKATVIVTSNDESWSFASVSTGGPKPVLLRKGDEIHGYALQAIGWDRLWFASGSERCEMILGDKGLPPPAPPTGPGEGQPQATRRPGSLPPELAARIHKVSDTEFTIDRSAVQEIVERQAELLGRVRVMPERDGTRVTGVKLGGVREDSLLAAVGLQNGDALQQINGFDVGDPHAALEAYAKLQNADRLTVTLQRQGRPMTIDLRFQ